jgi:hypothetical protein
LNSTVVLEAARSRESRFSVERYRFLGTILLAGAALAPLAMSGCAARVRVRVYDDYHADYHHLDDREDRACRAWLAERRWE